MKKNLRYLIFLLFLFFNTNILFSNEIKNIEIKGNQRIDEETIFTYLNLSKEKEIKEEDLNVLFKDLFATDLFSEIIFKITDKTLLLLN